MILKGKRTSLFLSPPESLSQSFSGSKMNRREMRKMMTPTSAARYCWQRISLSGTICFSLSKYVEQTFERISIRCTLQNSHFMEYFLVYEAPVWSVIVHLRKLTQNFVRCWNGQPNSDVHHVITRTFHQAFCFQNVDAKMKHVSWWYFEDRKFIRLSCH